MALNVETAGSERILEEVIMQLQSSATATGSSPILVVDDDKDVRDSLSELLQEEGFAVTAVSSGPEALKRLSLGMRPGMILLDVMMPGMTGLEVLEKVRSDQELADIPVTIMSGTHRIHASGRTGFLRKPINLDELLRVIHTRPEPAISSVL